MADEKSTMARFGARFLLISSFIFMVIMNALANIGTFNHTTVVQVSAEYPTRITPEGYAFSIWGLIWTFVAIFVIYFNVKKAAIDSLPWCVVAAFVVNCVGCGLWTMLFCYRLLLISFFCILTVVASTVYLYLTFYPGVSSAFPQCNLSYWCRGVAWSLLLGWISVASLVNLGTVFIQYNIGTSAAAQDAISVISLAVAGVIGFVVILRHEDILTVGVLLWALIAIAVKHNKDDVVLASSLIVGGACLGLILFSIARHVMRGKTTDYTNITSPKHVPGDDAHL